MTLIKIVIYGNFHQLMSQDISKQSINLLSKKNVESRITNEELIGSTYRMIVTNKDYVQLSSASIISELKSDDKVIAKNLPFEFEYNNHKYSTLYISSNGNIQFETSSNSLNNSSFFSNSGLKQTIAPFFDDLYPNYSGDIRYEVDGSTPNRVIQIEWNSVKIGNGSVTTKVCLYEINNEIEFQYGVSTVTNASASIGIVGSNGGFGDFIDASSGSSQVGITDIKIPPDNNTVIRFYTSDNSISLVTNSTYALNDTISISVQIGNQTPIDSLYTAAFKLNFDTTLVSFIPEKTQVGSFLGTNPISFFRKEAGTSFVDASVGATVGTNYSGTGELAKLFFKTKQVGTASFTLSDVQALTKSGAERTLVPNDTTVLIVDSNIDPIQNVHISNSGSRTVTIAWDAHNSSDVTAYRIYRSDGIQFEIFKAQVVSNQLSYSDNSIEYGTRYVFAVSAVTWYGLESPKMDVMHKSQLKDESDLAIHLTFSGNTGDASGNQFDMEGLHQGFIPDRYGRVAQAISFEGSESRLATKRFIALDSTSFTITFSEKKDTANGHILTHGKEYAAAKFLHIGYTQDRFTVRFFANDITTTETFENGIWRHWMIVYDKEAKTRKLYLNNTLISSEENIGQYYGEGRLVLGSNFNFTNLYKGELDDVRLYTKALDENELRTVFEADNAPNKPTGLTAQEKLGAVELTWRRSSELDLASYVIERKEGSGTFGVVGSRSVTDSPDSLFIDTSAKGGRTYTYRIRAVDISGLESESSETAKVTTTFTFADDLVAFYTFDGNVADSSGNGNDATASSTLTYTTDRFNNPNKSGSFNGGTKVNRALDVSEEQMTVSLWFKTTSSDRGLFSVVAYNPSGHDRHIYLSGNNIAARLWSDQTITSSEQNVSNDQWNHVVYVFGAIHNGQKLFVNGIEVASGDKKSSDFVGQTHIEIGFSADALNDYFLGSLDDIRIYNRALNEDQIKQLYALESFGIPPTVPSNLIASNNSGGEVRLSWEVASNANTANFEIYRGDSEQNLSLLTSVPNSAVANQTYIDKSIVRGQAYYYSVQAVSANSVKSGFSNTDSVLLPKIPAVNISSIAYDLSSKSVKLDWEQATESDAAFYVIRRKNDEFSYTNVAEIPVGTTSYTDTGIGYNKWYFYYVAVKDKNDIESEIPANHRDVATYQPGKVDVAKIQIDNKSSLGVTKMRPTIQFEPMNGIPSYYLSLPQNGIQAEVGSPYRYTFSQNLNSGRTYTLSIRPIIDLTVNGVGTIVFGEEATLNFTVVSYPQTTELTETITFSNKLSKADYKLIGFPGRFGATIDNWIPVNEKNTVMYEWNGSNSSFVEFNGTPVPGKGYWLLSDKNINLEISNLESVNKNSDSFTVSVHPNSWNLISNPFDKTLHWNRSVAVGNGQPILEWTGYGFNMATAMEVGKGYIWKNTNPNRTELVLDYYDLVLLPVAKVASKNPEKEVASTNFQEMNLFARLGSFDSAQKLTIGFVESEESLDEMKSLFEVEMPPLPFESSLISLKSDSTKQAKALLSKMIQKSEEGFSVPIQVDLVESDWVHWKWDTSVLPQDWKHALIDVQAGRVFEIHSDSLYLKWKKGSFDLLYVAGTSEFIEAKQHEFLPKSFALHQNYPNPFNPSTNISFALPDDRSVRLRVYDVMGRLVQTLVNESLKAGYYSFDWNASTLASGVYLARLESDSDVKIIKMVLLK